MFILFYGFAKMALQDLYFGSYQLPGHPKKHSCLIKHEMYNKRRIF